MKVKSSLSPTASCLIFFILRRFHDISLSSPRRLPLPHLCGDVAKTYGDVRPGGPHQMLNPVRSHTHAHFFSKLKIFVVIRLFLLIE